MLVNHGTNTISFRDVSFSYGSVPVLEHISFDITLGSYVGIIGPNGGGKTTLVHLIAGLLTPTAGEIHIFGHDANTAKGHLDVGFVPQRVSQIDSLFPATVREVVASGRGQRLGRFESLSVNDEKVIAEALRVTGIESFAHKQIGALSGGQLQRVFIARAVAAEPSVLLLDEPTVGIDAGGEAAFYELLHTLHTTRKLTIILVSHDVDTMVREVETVLCVNRELICHTNAETFSREKYETGLYGSQKTRVHHHHDHTES